jgi:hypothetical protein
MKLITVRSKEDKCIHLEKFYLSKTSKRKVLHAHGDYLEGSRKISNTCATSLVIFIGDLYSILEKVIPATVDSTINRVQNFYSMINQE